MITHLYYLLVELNKNFISQIRTVDGSIITLDTRSEEECNWMCLMRTASKPECQNCMALQLGMVYACYVNYWPIIVAAGI